MNRALRFTLLGLAVVVVLMCISAGCGGGSTEAASCEPNAVDDVAGVSDGQLLAIDASSPVNVLAVGGTPQFSLKSSLVVRYDGSAWERVPSPAELRMFDVAVIAEDDVWVLGTREKGPLEERLVRWDGRTWVEERAPKDVTYSALDALESDDVWLVGTQWRHGPSPFISHWDGSAWSRFTVEGVPKNVSLEDVAAYSSDVAWAVGNILDDRTGDPLKPVVLRWDGDQWNVMPAPQSEGAFDYLALDNVTVTGPNDIWSHTGFASEEILVHWDGEAWTRHRGPMYSYSSLASTDSALWAAGMRGNSNKEQVSIARAADEGWTYADVAVHSTDEEDAPPGLVALSEEAAWAAGGRSDCPQSVCALRGSRRLSVFPRQG